MARCNIIEDSPSLAVPLIDHYDYSLLNRQSAFNHSALIHCSRCGCLHCGSIFSGSQINRWIPEKHGEPTALCPYCGVDAVIYGTSTHPISTALLSQLYMQWFKTEFEKRESSAIYVPSFQGHDDYLRKGIPFRIATEGSIEFVGEIRLFPIFLFDDMDDATLYSADENEEDNPSCIDDTETVEEPCGGVVKVHACFDNDGFYIARFTDDSGRELPYEPWSGTEEDLVLDLSKRYGDRLRGLIVDSSFSTMRLFVEIDTDV